MSTNNQSGQGAGTTPIVIKVPAECKHLVEPIEALISNAAKTQRCLRSGAARAVDYASVEATVSADAGAIERAVHEGCLQALEIDEPQLLVRGERHTRTGYSEGTYRTMAGPVTFPRAVYRKDGVRNPPIVDAISLRIGAFGRGYLPGTALAMAHAVQGRTSREAAADAKKTGRLPYSRGSFERIAHIVGACWVRDQADIEDRVIEQLTLPKDPEVASISAALDRVSVPMEEPRKRPPGRPRKNAPKRPVERKYRMAYCGTVTLHDERGRGIRTFRFGCMPEGNAAALCKSMAGHVFDIRQRLPDPSCPITLLADGAAEMWNLLDDAFAPEYFDEVDRRIDFWHLIEKLSPAAKRLCADVDGQAVLKLKAWKASLRKSPRAAAKILAELRRSGLEHSTRNGKKPVHEAMTYIENNIERMGYADALRKKLPIGSGNVEATCKTLVALRMKRAGSRWKTDTGEHILRLRAVALSDYWDGAMNVLQARRRVAVRQVA